jgi:hypothetical protein
MNSALFLSGVCASTFFFSAIFFLKFWRATHDRFFLYFALACGLIAFERVVSLSVSGTMAIFASALTDASSWVYLIRLAAFLVILFAVWQKNRQTPPR